MEKLNFRTLQADEIDCRIATIKESGLSLLLYKDARVDQNMLDEVDRERRYRDRKLYREREGAGI